MEINHQTIIILKIQQLKGGEYMTEEINLRRLVIKSYHMDNVEFGEENNIFLDGKMTVCKDMIEDLIKEEPLIENIDIQIIKPGDHDRFTNTIMDIIPISTKVLGKIGEGITHTITGVYVISITRSSRSI